VVFEQDRNDLLDAVLLMQQLLKHFLWTSTWRAAQW
jgi:hypothetical protein